MQVSKNKMRMVDSCLFSEAFSIFLFKNEALVCMERTCLCMRQGLNFIFLYPECPRKFWCHYSLSDKSCDLKASSATLVFLEFDVVVCVCLCVCSHASRCVCLGVQCMCACMHSYMWVQACMCHSAGMQVREPPRVWVLTFYLGRDKVSVIPRSVLHASRPVTQALAYGFPSHPNTCVCPFGTSTFCWCLEIFSKSWVQWVKPEARPAFPSCASQSTPLLFWKISSLKKYWGSGHYGNRCTVHLDDCCCCGILAFLWLLLQLFQYLPIEVYSLYLMMGLVRQFPSIACHALWPGINRRSSNRGI